MAVLVSTHGVKDSNTLFLFTQRFSRLRNGSLPAEHAANVQTRVDQGSMAEYQSFCGSIIFHRYNDQKLNDPTVCIKSDKVYKVMPVKTSLLLFMP